MNKMLYACLMMAMTLAAGCATPARNDGAKRYDVAAFYWPAYHTEPRWTEIAGWKENMGEWEIIKSCKPGFPGHQQPNVPLWGYEDESKPKVMEKKIDAAVSHGVNVFIFDWYWYDNQPFLEDCINNGFLKARNAGKIKFYLMWANHDVGNGWNREKADLPGPVIWPGAVDRKTFDTVVDRVIAKYMKHKSYYKIDGKPVFAIYELGSLIKGLGGVEQTRQALDSFREKVKAAGFPGLHIQVMVWGSIPMGMSLIPGDTSQTQDNTIKALGIDSLTSYQWVHTVAGHGEYEKWAETGMSQWEQRAREFSVPYYPHVSIGWDPNPRVKIFRDEVVVNRSPEVFKAALRRAREYVDKHPLPAKLITINSWNEWSEGSYLEPDERFGMKYLEAVKEVFGTNSSKK